MYYTARLNQVLLIKFTSDLRNQRGAKKHSHLYLSRGHRKGVQRPFGIVIRRTFRTQELIQLLCFFDRHAHTRRVKPSTRKMHQKHIIISRVNTARFCATIFGQDSRIMWALCRQKNHEKTTPWDSESTGLFERFKHFLNYNISYSKLTTFFVSKKILKTTDLQVIHHSKDFWLFLKWDIRL